MKTAEDVEKEFFNLTKNKIKKISLNLGVETIKKVDMLADIFGINRTLVIESMLILGIPEYVKMYKESDKKVRKMKEYEKKISILDQRLKELDEFNKKWKYQF